MKRILSFTMIMILSICFAGCKNTGTEFNPANSGTPADSTENTEQNSESSSEESADTKETGNRVLIVYFSREDENYGVGVIEKGNTEIVAEIIAEQTGGELSEILTVKKYPEGYDECTEVAKQEQEENARPELSTLIENMDDYDKVYLGYPIWWRDCPMAVYTFLESYDFSGKTIFPFCTHAGSGISGTEDNIQNVCPDSEVLTGFAMEGETAQNNYDETKQQVIEWLNE